MSGRAKNIGLAVLAVLCLGAVVWALHRPQSSNTGAPPVKSATRAVIFGDSYVVGIGASDVARAYPTLVGERMRWNLTTVAEGGTGFLADGPNHDRGAYDTRIAAVVKARPDIVIVQASGNDYAYSTARIKAAAAAFFDKLRKAVPAARIVVLGPMYGQNPQTIPHIDAGVRAATQAAGLAFIDAWAEHWFTGSKLDGTGNAARLIGDPDASHPTDAGHRWIADHLVAALNRLGFRRP